MKLDKSVLIGVCLSKSKPLTQFSLVLFSDLLFVYQRL